MIIHKKLKQGSKEWLDLRLGKMTGSNFSKFLYSKKVTKANKTALRVILAEILTGKYVPVFGKALDWGTYYEPFAKELIQKQIKLLVKEVGFVEPDKKTPLHGWVGTSPDGLVGEDKIIEIKCPYNSSIHLNTVLENVVPKEYMAQIQGNLWILERKSCIYASYDPRIKQEEHRLHTISVERDEEFIEKLESNLLGCLAVLEDYLTILKNT